MPLKNGLLATEEIRAMQRADANIIPILAMTANTFQEDREKAMATGMTGFLYKPFDVNQLYQALRQSIHEQEINPGAWFCIACDEIKNSLA